MNDKLTIVGPEPGDGDTGNTQRVHVEALLLMAKYDTDFRQQLLDERAQALDASEIAFTAGERLLLMTVSRDQLADTIDSFKIQGVSRTSIPDWKKAAAVILLLTGLIFVEAGCRLDEGQSKGVMPDAEQVTPEEPGIPKGIVPDEPKSEAPKEKPDAGDLTRGAMPDEKQP